jgi:hypothetical protein
MCNIGKNTLAIILGFLFACASLALLAPPAFSQANVKGQWQTLPYTMPINPIHAAMLYNGSVLIIAGSGNYPPNTTYQWALYNPQTGNINVQTMTWDMFCNGMSILPDGRPFISGGTIQYDPFFGQPRSAIYDVASNSLVDAEPMAHGRWYPTTTILGNGSLLTFSGLSETGGTNTAVEIYTPGTGWSPQYTASWTPPLYPRLHLLPNGNVFYSGSSPVSSIFNPSTHTWSVGVATTNYNGTRLYGSSVMLPLTPANGYKPQVMIMGGGNPSTASTEIIDLSAATPKWVFGPNMSAPRIEMNSTILPTGKILALGGSLNDEDINTAALNADLYDPVSNTFSSAGTEAFPRLYHSVSLLLPDATVWVAGGNPERGTYEPHMEIYSPAYLFNSDGSLATRPSITSVSNSVIGYANSFSVTTPDAANISSVVLMRNGAVTHAFNMDQRYVGLSFTAGSGVLNVTGPPTGNIAPPGYYMLFLLNSAGVPSVAQMVQLSNAPSDTPPTGTITSPSANQTIVAGQSVNYSGTGTSAGNSIAGYSWFLEGGNPGSSNLANPGNVTYATPGTFVSSLTVTDSSGITDPNPPFRIVTVNTAFALLSSPTTRPITQGATTTFAVTVTGNPGFSGNVGLTLTGLPPGASASFSPASINTSGTSTLTITTTGSVAAGGYPLTINASTGVVTETTPVILVIAQNGGPTPVNFASGFSSTGMELNGAAVINNGALQLTDGVARNGVGSAFWTTPVNVQSFANDFTFLLNTNGDGITFTIQNVGATAIGLTGGGLGFASLGSSVGIKFDLFNNNGEGSNSTGVYTQGASPELPATTFGGGVNLHSGDIMQAHMTYNGTTLTLTVTDTAVPTQTFTTSWTIAIPSTVGANTAYIGFTGSTGSIPGAQQILSWTYTSGTMVSPTATPLFSLPSGSYTGTQKVSILDATSGSSIFYTLDGSQPQTAVGGSTFAYSGPISVTTSTTINAIATAPGFNNSIVASSPYTILGATAPNFTITATPNTLVIIPGVASAYSVTVTPLNGFTGVVTFAASGLPVGVTGTFSPTSVTNSGATSMTITSTTTTALGTYPIVIMATSGTLHNSTSASLVISTPAGGGPSSINFARGFSSTGMQFNGSSKLNGTALQLTDANGTNEVGTAFFGTPVNITGFANDFTFLLNTNGDGITFTIQSVGPTAVGGAGGGLGFSTIGSSVGVKFDLFNNNGEGNNSVGEYNKGASPQMPAITLGGGVNLHSGDVMLAHMTYSGNTLTLTVTDTAVPTETFTTSWTVSIQTEVVGSMAYVGFTGSTGSAAASQQILTWTYTSGTITSPAATPTFTPVAGSYPGSQSVTIIDASPNPSIFYTVDGSQPQTVAGGATVAYSGPITVASTETINAIATAAGFNPSIVSTASYAIGSNPADFAITSSPASQSIAQGASTSYGITVTPSNGFMGVVSFAVSGLPAGATPTFTPTSVSGSGSTTLSIATTTAIAPGSYPLTITGTSGTLNNTASVTLVITQAGGGGSTSVNFASGFSSTGMQFNGSSTLSGSALQLTDGTTPNEAGSAFWATPVNVQNFVTDFTFLLNTNGDGITFVVQNAGLTALGNAGGGLGFASLGASSAVKFDLFSNNGEGNNSTGEYNKGASPGIPATTIGGGVNLHSGDIMSAHITYNGTTLTLTITDTVVPTETFTTSWTVFIPAEVGANTAYVGFTGSTGSLAAVQQILTWSYTPGTTISAAATPTFTPAAGNYSGSQSVTILDSTSSSSIFYTVDGSAPQTAVGGSTAAYAGPIPVTSSKTVKAIATATGFNPSAIAGAAYTITAVSFSLTSAPASQSIAQGAPTSYTITVGPSSGFTGTVTFAVSGLPSGATGTFSPTSVTTSGSTVLTVLTNSTVAVGTYPLTITGTSGSLTSTTSASLAITTANPGSINFSSGFSPTGMQLNGSSTLSGSALQLTDGTTVNEAGSAFWTTPVNVVGFTTDFTFLLNTNGDGITFVIQNAGLTAVGKSGGGLGFATIGSSTALKFDLFSNNGEGNNSTGVYNKGASPEVPATTIGGGVNLHSGDIMHAHITYSGATLTLTITDTVVPADTFTTSWTVSIPTEVGANTAYVGFTGSTGSVAAVEQILTWTYSN